MEKVSMLTVIPTSLAKELVDNKSVKNYNTLPQINKAVLEAVREFMTDNVGYSHLPMACFGKPAGSESLLGDAKIFNVLPVNWKENVLFQLDMPSDMIISVQYNDLLGASSEANEIADEDELIFLKEDFKEKLALGLNESHEDPIIFIPFLALDKCKFYAKFNDEFSTEELNLPGLEKMDVRMLKSFID